MDAQDNRKSLAFGIPGIALQLGGNVAYRMLEPLENPLWLGITLLGTGLLIVGLAFYAKAKGYHPAFGLFGLLSIIGLIVLAVLPDKRK